MLQLVDAAAAWSRCATVAGAGRWIIMLVVRMEL
jgi:hypothetical protein